MKAFSILFIVIFAFVSGSYPMNHLKKCTEIDCAKENVALIEETDGPVYRYSKNAANFNEAKVPPRPNPTNTHSGGQGPVPVPVPKGSIQSQPHTRTASSPKTQRTNNNVHPASGGSVLGDAGAVGNSQQLPTHQQQVAQQQQQQQDQQQRPTTGTNTMGKGTAQNTLPIARAPGNQDHPKGAAGIQAVEEGIYWSAAVESAIPPGLSHAEVETWAQRIRKLKVVKVEDASREKCGSNMNRHVVFEDGSTSCARYRHPMTHLVFGDMYSYYLARILGLQNVPAVVLSKVNYTDSSSQWSLVTEQIRNATWVDDTVASFSLWIEGLGKTDLPEILFVNQHSSLTASSPGFTELNITQLVELAQFSDLFIFDFITAHLDRMTIRKNAVAYYNMDSLYKGEIHNLVKHKNNGGLWFLDNENGIFNAYTVAYGNKNKDEMQGFIEEVLHSMCIFRRSTVDVVNKLAQMDNPYQLLNQTVYANEPVAGELRLLPRWQPASIQERFKERVLAVMSWIGECRSRSSDNGSKFL